MTRSELVKRVSAHYPHLHLGHAEKVVDAVLDAITEILERGGRAELRNFGSFSIRNRQSRAGRDPRTGNAIFVAESWAPFFRASKELRTRLNRRG
ncbi:HU family DNA-binding protein [Rhizobium grahamii]|uniref:Integration host factor subunit beta n=1 Tax=Rhizobium grahamii CCGE 502 TaxID=990285 RepID=S3HTL1_9HYPH|nr:HU family DNA-binding protein [Rhizobium grahamii]EPE96541.1 integration host factor subunit beta [Rhizobium grahamii CCGE 502]